ncbi:MAG: hypothetical protein WDM96_06320 [Lacunisphaera sp.]
MSDSIPGKFSRSWLLFRTSLQVIQQNKKLLLFRSSPRSAPS